MSDRPTCERRVYRLAVLLTGRPKAALSVLESVLSDDRDLGRLDTAHLDRLTILRSRECGRAGALPGAAVDPAAAQVLARLPSQSREAWLLTWVDGRDERQMARAMDCSITASQRHLARADELMSELVDREVIAETAVALKTFAESLDVPEVYHIRRRRRRRWRWIIRIAIILVIIGVAAAAAAWWARRA